MPLSPLGKMHPLLWGMISWAEWRLVSLFSQQLVQLSLASEQCFGKVINDLLLAKSNGYVSNFILLLCDTWHCGEFPPRTNLPSKWSWYQCFLIFILKFWQFLSLLHGFFFSSSVVPDHFGTRGQFRRRQFFQGWGRSWGNDSGGNASDGEWQMKLRSLTCRLPPAVRPGSQQATDR